MRNYKMSIFKKEETTRNHDIGGLSWKIFVNANLSTYSIMKLKKSSLTLKNLFFKPYRSQTDFSIGCLNLILAPVAMAITTVCTSMYLIGMICTANYDQTKIALKVMTHALLLTALSAVIELVDLIGSIIKTFKTYLTPSPSIQTQNHFDDGNSDDDDNNECPDLGLVSH